MSKKTCFVTVGATAAFDELVSTVLQPGFLIALQNQGYTDLLVQYGVGKEQFNKSSSATTSSSMKVSGFDLDRAGLNKYMREVAGGAGSSQGCVISHAGRFGRVECSQS